eukprot:scaffold25434_cov118-Isochrysis_galbana.AAC.2
MPALRPGGKGSLRARVKAGMSTRSRSAGSRYCAILPRQIVVLVRMAASSSSCSLAKARITSPSVARDSLGASGTTLLTVSSRSTGEVSAKPSETCPKMDSLMVRWRDAHGAVGVGKQLDDGRHHLRLHLLFTQHGGDGEERLERLGRGAAVLERVGQGRQHLPLRGRLGHGRHPLGQLGEEAVLLDRVLDVEHLEEQVQRDVRVLEERVLQQLDRAQALGRVGRQQTHVVGLELLRHVANLLQVGRRFDLSAENLKDGAAERPPVGRHRERGQHLHVAPRQLGRLVPLGQGGRGATEVGPVCLGRLDRHLKPAQLPVHPLVHKHRGERHLAMDHSAVDRQEVHGGRQRVQTPRQGGGGTRQLGQRVTQGRHRLRQKIDYARVHELA